MRVPRGVAFDELIRFDRERRGLEPRLIAGVDESGRGALAGPVVAAAVICEPNERLCRVRDSKLVAEKERERLYDQILEHSTAWSVAQVDPREIDRINILKASLKAMKLAVEALEIPPSLVLVDGNVLPEIGCAAEAIVGGDDRSFSIAAASIVAKVTRDRIMRRYAESFRGYAFDRNKGYGTKEHFAAIRKKGLTELHRRSFVTHG
jgi:ribonuclease HII